MKYIAVTYENLMSMKYGMRMLVILAGMIIGQSAVAQKFSVTPLTENAVRIQYGKPSESKLPELMYVNVPGRKLKGYSVEVNNGTKSVVVKNRKGQEVFKTTDIALTNSTVQGEPTKIAQISFVSPLHTPEYQYGLGQFQDGYTNVKGLVRRLTQVNTQISIPMVMSSNGYAVLWNNYGMTEFNPCSESIDLTPANENGEEVNVNVTSTSGNAVERRSYDTFNGTIYVSEDADYAMLLDVGQAMARRQYISIDGVVVVNENNPWLPPTTSLVRHLSKGSHKIVFKGVRGDKPQLYWRKVDETTTFRSPVSECVDFTVFLGKPDEIISAYRTVTGKAAPMPQWALGYIHCRERFHNQQELLENAQRFRSEDIPISVIVQDWQYWGKYGWNAMRFDEDNYPDPKKMTDELHKMDIRLMLSVWSKIDGGSDVGKQAAAKNFYIPGTEWIDFFNPDAAAFYWKNFSEKLHPLGIDCWWQDATEPENDDLVGRRVAGGTLAGEWVRNAYPLMVSKTVYEGLVSANSNQTNKGYADSFILTRCGFPGIQRYGAALWSGDVSNEWETLRRQICAGLGLMAAGIPWWTYDAGGFFRPGDQYTNADYQEKMIRWIQTSVFLPLMRVHGYTSNTEPWNYPESVKKLFVEQIKLRYALMPYIEKEAAKVAEKDYTLMRPLVFDFSDDEEALKQETEFMFGSDLLINPILKGGVTKYKTYLPKIKGKWCDFWTGEKYSGGQYVETDVTIDHIPVFTRGYTLKK